MQRLTTSMVASAVIATTACCTTTTSQKRSIRNLHRNKQERYKSQVKNPNYNRKWELLMNNNHELIEEKAHEREATENFARYRYDDSTRRFIRYISDPETLSSRRKYDYYYSILTSRKGMTLPVKCMYALHALESFRDMAQEGEIASQYSKWKELEQNHFIWLVDHVLENARPILKTRHTAVAFAIRAAAICDELGCTEKRDNALSASESMVAQMEKGYAYTRRGESLPPLISVVHDEGNVWASVRATIAKERKAKEELARLQEETKRHSNTPTLPAWSSMTAHAAERKRLENIPRGNHFDRPFTPHTPFAPKAWAYIPHHDDDDTNFRLKHQTITRIDEM